MTVQMHRLGEGALTFFGGFHDKQDYTRMPLGGV